MIKIFLYLYFIFSLPIHASEQSTIVRDPAAEQKYIALERSYLWLEKEIQNKKTQIQEGSYKKPELIEQINSLESKLLQLRVRMIEELTGLGLNIDIEKPIPSKRDILHEVQELIGPLLDGIKRISERPRKVEKLHAEVELLKADQLQYIDAKNIFIEKSEFLKEESRTQLLAWLDNQLSQLELEKQTRERELNLLMGEKKSILDQITEMLSIFFRTKGKHLSLALVALMLTLWLSLKMKPFFFKIVVGPKTDHLKKFIEAIYDVVTVFICLSSFLVSLYLLNDWVLFTVTLVIVFGITWSLKQFLPTMLEQLRMILNLGLVKEGERLMWDGIPWRIESIGLQVSLVNEEIEGARINIPTKHLIGKNSRPIVPQERWFPTRRGDWISFNEGRLAEVVKQNVDFVTLRMVGGTEILYATNQFINMPMENYRHGIRISIIVGIDYENQDVACDEYLTYFQKQFEQAIILWPDSSLIKNIAVDFEAAAGSSLNYIISLDCDGSLAPKRDVLSRMLQKQFVTSCNLKKINIPFPQMTISARDDFWKNKTSIQIGQ